MTVESCISITMSSTEGLADTFNHYVISRIKKQPTLHVTMVPNALQKPAILAGYRQINQPWQYYFLSFFHIHNETVNVWTHSIAIIILWNELCDCTREYGISNKHLAPMAVYLMTTMMTCFISAATHLLHSKSTDIHYTACMIDFIGVNLYAFGSGVISFYLCSEKVSYNFFGSLYIPLLILATWFNTLTFCYTKFTYGNNPYNLKRTNICIGSTAVVGIFICVPFLLRYWECLHLPECSVRSLHHLTICPVLLAIEAFFFGSHVPERLMPGKCDIVGQGHQIFHVLSTITMLMEIKAAREDYDAGRSTHTHPNAAHLFFATLAVVILNFATLLYMHRWIKYFSEERQK